LRAVVAQQGEIRSQIGPDNGTGKNHHQTKTLFGRGTRNLWGKVMAQFATTFSLPQNLKGKALFLGATSFNGGV